MTIKETKEIFDKCFELKKLTDEVEDIEDFIQNCCEISIRIEYPLKHHYNLADIDVGYAEYNKMLQKICLSVLKANLEKDLAELKEKLSKIEIKIGTKN